MASENSLTFADGIHPVDSFKRMMKEDIDIGVAAAIRSAIQKPMTSQANRIIASNPSSAMDALGYFSKYQQIMDGKLKISDCANEMKLKSKDIIFQDILRRYREGNNFKPSDVMRILSVADRKTDIELQNDAFIDDEGNTLATLFDYKGSVSYSMTGLCATQFRKEIKLKNTSYGGYGNRQQERIRVKTLPIRNPITGSVEEFLVDTNGNVGDKKVMISVIEKVPQPGEGIYCRETGIKLGVVKSWRSQSDENKYIVLIESNSGSSKKRQMTIQQHNMIVKFPNDAFPSDLQSIHSVGSIRVWTESK